MNKPASNILLSLASVLGTLLFLEIGLRVATGEYTLENFIVKERMLMKSAYPCDFHRRLGWIPKPNTVSLAPNYCLATEHIWKTRITLGEDGIRSNGNARTPDGPPILAIGDSFTFGDEVSDGDTWPSFLEALTGRKVLNAGVFGYGLDQVFLRAVPLIRKYKPSAIVLSVIPDDIDRCQLSKRSNASKPYFDVDGDEKLVLRNTPVPKPELFAVDPLQKVLGHSLLAHRIMTRINRAYWQSDRRNLDLVHRVHEDGLKVTKALIRRLNRIAIENGIEDVYVVFEYGLSDPWRGDNRMRWLAGELAAVPDSRYRLVDLDPVFDSLWHEDKPYLDSLYAWFHLSREGNYVVARQIWKTWMEKTHVAKA